MGKIKEYDRKMRKRLAISFPISLLVLFLILLSMEKTDVVRKIVQVGYRGPMQLVPEIQIVNETGLQNVTNKEKKQVMKVEDIRIEGEKAKNDKGKKPREKEGTKNANESKGNTEINNLYRNYPSRAKVPYREDYVILKMVKPAYPADALEMGMEGYVLVEVYVDKNGKVGGAWVRSSYGPISFEKSALDAVKQFVFDPIKENGKPISFWVSFLIRFRLRY
ncbi:MAG: hypothetical protein B6D63_01040 [Candidatus Latescibacteria bacterium 4484_7]|nr:MAG: hypothetical protein B6D63_01040 [Candidatus Latescibacteria bacterium 4484_7]